MAQVRDPIKIGPIFWATLECQAAYRSLVAAAKAHKSVLPENLKIYHFQDEFHMFASFVAIRHIHTVVGPEADPPVDSLLERSTCLRGLILELLNKLESELRQGTHVHAHTVDTQC